MGLFGKLFGNEDTAEVDPVLRRAIEHNKELNTKEFWAGYEDGYKRAIRRLRDSMHQIRDDMRLHLFQTLVLGVIGSPKEVVNADTQHNPSKLGYSLGRLSATFKYFDATLNSQRGTKYFSAEDVMKTDMEPTSTYDAFRAVLQQVRDVICDRPDILQAAYTRAMRPVTHNKAALSQEFVNDYADAVSVLRP